MNMPKDRYVIDITYLPIEIIGNTEYKYLLNISDHFSKFIISFLLMNKNADSIVEKLKICFDKFNVSKQIGCDNGTEFNNKNVINLLESLNMQMIRGHVYNPNSQGIIERAHRTIKNGLICLYLEKNKDFTLVNDLELVVNRYNTMIHSTTKKNL